MFDCVLTVRSSNVCVIVVGQAMLEMRQTNRPISNKIYRSDSEYTRYFLSS